MTRIEITDRQRELAHEAMANEVQLCDEALKANNDPADIEAINQSRQSWLELLNKFC